jgi:hypothetical protein
VRRDPVGAARAAARLGPDVRQAVASAAQGRWPRGPLLRLELRALRHALERPRSIVRRRRAAELTRACPLLLALGNERTIGGDLDRWLAAVAGSHVALRREVLR